ncbi:glycosyltransferase family 2 protein [Herbaspirillum rubrisubalbicans]|uniref:glycosyltransferase family 2 protein n=1 Tax=Herbaspirillum rubrisubalbicans TaxID=80842 RepID=UPI00155836BD|nr:glycosyltransferase family 2 protein [Herbaspirillum rubrisubalbicans]NQE51542.1 glycosyl transferase family 2 [Herbaspirillum rubrisubalbicans]
MKLSLIIPCYNESPNLPLLLERCGQLAAQPGVEVVLVDNGSTDNSPRVLQELLPKYPGCRSVRVDVNQGYGFGILSGLRTAEGEYLGWTHADMQTDPMDALRAMELLARHGRPAYAKGRRYGRPLADVFFTMGMSAFETVLLGKALWDINAQPNIFPRTFFQTWENPPHDFSLDLYAYFMAKQSGLDVLRFPVRFGERAHGTSHWNVNWAAKRKFIRRTIDFSLQLRKSLKS